MDGVVAGGAAPLLESNFPAMGRRYFGAEPFWVTATSETGLNVLYDNPREVGDGRIVNAVAALEKFGGPCIVAGLGTAITFDAASARGEYLGGGVCPGIGISIAGLFQKAAQLPAPDFRDSGRLTGANALASMQSERYCGPFSMIDGIVERRDAEPGAGTRTAAAPRSSPGDGGGS